uniref:Uncharacterized protein n=1 Tax=Romanomermis culicivorax TaxID=13658 RepID=A0A915KGY1_ROMCU
MINQPTVMPITDQDQNLKRQILTMLPKNLNSMITALNQQHEKSVVSWLNKIGNLFHDKKT